MPVPLNFESGLGVDRLDFAPFRLLDSSNLEEPEASNWDALGPMLHQRPTATHDQVKSWGRTGELVRSCSQSQHSIKDSDLHLHLKKLEDGSVNIPLSHFF